MASLDFLAEGNVCGQNLLKLTARGAAIIAELLRLSDNIPPVFYLSDRQDQMRYHQLLFDCSYTANQELYESRIASDGDLVDLDEEFRETHLELLERYYMLFESIFKYIQDLIHFLEDVEEGVYIQHTVEDILMNMDGKQLLTEAFYLYGLQLTLLDDYIEGPVRERMLMAYLRYKGQTDLFSEVVNLCKSTGYSLSAQKRPPNYPESYFARVTVPKNIVSMIVSRLRSDDIYNQQASWPSPEHRSTALANQASMLYLILFFVPDILHKEQSAMREIVDKHFNDNWVIPYYMGYIVDLTFMWEPYKAAAKALANTVEPKNVKEVCRRHLEKVKPLTADVMHHLTEGVLVEEFCLDNISKLLNLLRNSNATVRWIMLHRNTTHKKLKELLVGINTDDLLVLLFQTAQLEFKLKDIFNRLLETKQSRWDHCKEESVTRMQELSRYFSGEQALTRVQRDEQLMNWFNKIANEIAQVEFHDSTLAGRRIHQLVSALQDVDQFHQIETNFQVKHFLTDTRTFLHQMLRIVNIKEEIAVTMSVVSDMSYAFNIMNSYVEKMHAKVKEDPVYVILLRATFLKMASILDLPLVRINQAASADLESVAEYYSGKLVAFVRTVLEVIPKNMFIILDSIIHVQATALKVFPTRMEKAFLKDYAQPEDRYKLARATHMVSVFTEGILAMEKTLVGIIEIDPKQLLEDGIRKELVNQISKSLHLLCIFRTGKLADFEAQLSKLEQQLDGFRRSFEYISDYVNIYGLKIWQEEFTRIVNFNVEQECNVFLKQKIYPWQSRHQSVAIEIPTFLPLDEKSVNFVGRLCREILNQSNFQRTTYLDTRSGWYDYTTGKEVVGIRTFSLLHRSIGTAGIAGLDKTLAFMIVKELQMFVRFYRRELQAGLKDFLPEVLAELTPTSALPASGPKVYSAAVNRPLKLWSSLLGITCRIGQAQLLRRAFANELNFVCRLDSNLFYNTLDNLNKSIMMDVREHYRSPETKPYPDSQNPLLGELTTFLDNAGISSPLLKIYITTEPLEGFALSMFLFVVSQINKFYYDKTLGIMMCRDRKDGVDAAAFVVGVLTIIKQFHSANIANFLAFCSQYLRLAVTGMNVKDNKYELPMDVLNFLYFLEDFCNYGKIDRGVVQEHVPPYLLDKFRRSF